MITYEDKERAKYWPISPELMAQYKDGSHTFEYDSNDLMWYQNSKLHRDGDKPAIIKADGNLNWYKNNQQHRFSGPAVIYLNGRKEWYWRGELIPVKSQEEFFNYLN